MYKLQCSKCDEKFNTENSFAIHIDVCLKNAERDVHVRIFKSYIASQLYQIF